MGSDSKGKTPTSSMEEAIARQNALSQEAAKGGKSATVSTRSVSAGLEAIIGELPPEIRSHYELWMEVGNKTDRGAAILAAAYLDARLSDAIKARFYRKGATTLELLAPSGFIGQYAAKCKVAYCLGLYGSTVKQDLEKIGDIRNRFAHRKELLSFSDEKIRKLCDDIKLEYGSYFEPTPDKPARSRYLNTVQGIGIILAREILRTDQPKLLLHMQTIEHCGKDTRHHLPFG